MGERTELYLSGMQSVNDFFEMLYAAMLEAMPRVLLSDSGAYVWRGYRIDAYEDLANGQYYCQISPPSDPRKSRFERYQQAQDLLFKESYQEYRKPLASLDKDFGINSGAYYYPFKLTLSLYQSRFFLLECDEQYAMLRDFVAFASSQALLWQRSEARANLTSPNRLIGKKPPRALHKTQGPYERVSIDYMDAFDYQFELLKKQGDLEMAIWKTAPQISGKEIDWLEPNAHWRNWDFRGWRLRFIEDDPNNRAVYRWNIYWQEPEKMVCLLVDGNQKELLGYLDLKDIEYFDLPTAERSEVLEEFVEQMLSNGSHQNLKPM